MHQLATVFMNGIDTNFGSYIFLISLKNLSDTIIPVAICCHSWFLISLRFVFMSLYLSFCILFKHCRIVYNQIHYRQTAKVTLSVRSFCIDDPRCYSKNDLCWEKIEIQYLLPCPFESLMLVGILLLN